MFYYLFTDARDYYKLIYEARFGSVDKGVQKQHVCSRKGRYPLPLSSATLQNSYIENTVVNSVSQDRYQENTNCFERVPDRSCPEGKHDEIVASYDSSRYSDSPPVETQGYRILSQMNRVEAEQKESPSKGTTELLFWKLNIIVLSKKVNIFI